MKIVQIITSAEWGGAQRHVFDLACGLRDLGHNVTVLYGSEGRLRRKLDDQAIPAMSVPSLTRTIHPVKDLRILSSIRRQIEDLSPDLVHVHSSKAGVLVRLAMRSSAVPVVYTVHGLVYLNSRMPRWKKWFYRTLELSLLPMAQATIAVSTRDLEEYQRYRQARNARLIHIANGIDPFPDPIPLPELPIIGTIGRFTEEKAIDLILEAAAMVRKRIPAVQVLLVGDGPLRPSLERLAHDLSIDDITRFAGFQENVGEWLGKMRVFVLSSVKEGMPYALLEAVAARRIIVANDVGAVGEVVSALSLIDGEGKSASRLAKHLLRVLESPDAPPDLGSGVVCSKLDMVRQTHRLYADVLGISDKDG